MVHGWRIFCSAYNPREIDGPVANLDGVSFYMTMSFAIVCVQFCFLVPSRQFRPMLKLKWHTTGGGGGGGEGGGGKRGRFDWPRAQSGVIKGAYSGLDCVCDWPTCWGRCTLQFWWWENRLPRGLSYCFEQTLRPFGKLVEWWY